MAKLVDLTVKEFIDTLNSDAPAPGGGSASALAAAMGISLTNMVALLTEGKKKYADGQEAAKNIIAEAKDLKVKLVEAIDKDTEAFNAVSAVFKMPKETDEEKAARKEAMQEALKGAAESPLEMMKMIVKAIHITDSGVGKLNPNAASDLGVAALNLKSGLRGAWLNVLINLDGIKDEDFIQNMKKEGQDLLAEGEELADKVYEAILSNL